MFFLGSGHTIQVTVPPGNFLTYGKQRFELQQFHFHVPSERSMTTSIDRFRVRYIANARPTQAWRVRKIELAR